MTTVVSPASSKGAAAFERSTPWPFVNLSGVLLRKTAMVFHFRNEGAVAHPGTFIRNREGPAQEGVLGHGATAIAPPGTVTLMTSVGARRLSAEYYQVVKGPESEGGVEEAGRPAAEIPNIGFNDVRDDVWP